MNSIFGRTVASGAHLGLYGHGTYHILVGESIRTIPYGSEYKRYSRYRRYIRFRITAAYEWRDGIHLQLPSEETSVA